MIPTTFHAFLFVYHSFIYLFIFLGAEILGLFVLCLVIVICFAQGSLSATVISLFALVSQNDSKGREKLFHYCCLLIKMQAKITLSKKKKKYPKKKKRL